MKIDRKILLTNQMRLETAVTNTLAYCDMGLIIGKVQGTALLGLALDSNLGKNHEIWG
jgi:hypothetical protein